LQLNSENYTSTSFERENYPLNADIMYYYLWRLGQESPAAAGERVRSIALFVCDYAALDLTRNNAPASFAAA
jgi:hypothetical protein